MTRQNSLEVVEANRDALPPDDKITSLDQKWGIGYLRISSDPTDRRLGVTYQREDVIKLA